MQKWWFFSGKSLFWEQLNSWVIMMTHRCRKIRVPYISEKSFCSRDDLIKLVFSKADSQLSNHFFLKKLNDFIASYVDRLPKTRRVMSAGGWSYIKIFSFSRERSIHMKMSERALSLKKTNAELCCEVNYQKDMLWRHSQWPIRSLGYICLRSILRVRRIQTKTSERALSLKKINVELYSKVD